MRIKNMLIAVLVTVVYMAPVRADVIPPDHHYVDRCVTITNVDSFPDVILLGVIAGPMVNGYEWYVVEPGKCLHKGYKFNGFYLVWADRGKVDSASIDTLDLETLLGRKKAAASGDGLHLLTDQINPGGYYVPDTDPLVEEDAYYTLLSNKQDELEIYLSKQVTRYNDGSPEKTETFSASIGDRQGLSGALTEKPEILVCPTHLIVNVPRAGKTGLSIFNVSGLEVFHKEFHCKQEEGNIMALPHLGPGVYMFRLESGNSTFTRDFLILR